VSLLWSESQYATGVPAVDAQHKQMFDHIDRMIRASEVKEKETEFIDMLEFLNGYVVEHFRCEETAMEQRGCPALDENKQDHLQFLERLNEMKARFETEGNTRPLREDMMAMAVQWLEAHIAGVDAKLRGCAA
jgi:hemerythrin